VNKGKRKVKKPTSTTPVIDAHVHLFNALDIPLEGYLRSRSPDFVNFFLPYLFTYLTNRMRDRCVWRQQIDQYDEILEILDSEEEKEALKEYARPPTDESESQKLIYMILLKLFSLGSGQRLDQWEDSLTRDTERLADDLVDTEWVRRVDLYVPLVVDFEYWFKNTLDHDVRAQIDCVYKDAVLPHCGRIHPFVPFDPARQLAWERQKLTPDGQRPEYGSLELVKDAIENKGFIGVKLYNSLGYRPLGNADLLAVLQRKRVAVRNEKMQYLFEGAEYDRVLRELYQYCEENGVPITAHCQTGGIEAYPEASYHFGNPVLWRDVVEEYPNLRLNLAHFAWGQGSGYRDKRVSDLVKAVCSMMINYNYVYADVSHHHLISRRGHRMNVASYRAICNDYAGKGLEKLKRRLLYGSDWHVLRRVRSFESFMKHYITVLRQANFYAEEEIGDFLGGNALEFLGLLPGGKNRERLEDFYTRKKIPLPNWFTSTADLQPAT
jgi:predicted TIM-barrel fold metal-dependent hydrolase